MIAEWRDAGGPAGPPRFIAPPHVHHSDDEAWYVLEGVLCVRSGSDDIEARPGLAAYVPRGMPASYVLESWPDPVRYLLVLTANIFSLIQDIHALQERNPVTLREVFRNTIPSYSKCTNPR